MHFALISQMVPYLIFIVMSKTTDFLNMALVSQNAQSLHNFAFYRPTTITCCPSKHQIEPVFCSIGDIQIQNENMFTFGREKISFFFQVICQLHNTLSFFHFAITTKFFSLDKKAYHQLPPSHDLIEKKNNLKHLFSKYSLIIL